MVIVTHEAGQTGAAEGKLPKGGQSGKSFSVEKRRKLERQVGGERVLEGEATAAGCGDHAPSPGASHLLLVFQSPWLCQVGEKGQAVSSLFGWSFWELRRAEGLSVSYRSSLQCQKHY